MHASVDLDRQFSELPPEATDEAQILAIAQARRSLLGWSDLLERKLVTVLAPARAGKTFELEQMAPRLRAQNRTAFFLRLDVLADTDLKRSCVPHEEALEKWLTDSAPGWFFLDARDEVALSNRLLSTALRNLRYGLGAAVQRARILITSRPWDWSRADRLDFETLLASPREHTTAAEMSAPTDSIDASSAAPISRTNGEPDKPEPALIVALAPLDLKRIQLLAGAWGVSDVTAFGGAIEQSSAITMAGRPGDLEGLVERWKTYGTLGTYETVMRTTIEWRLKDKRLVPGALMQLSADQYHRGARRLAATLTLARTEAFRLPDAEASAGPDPGVAAQDAFPDWTPQALGAVLRTSIFDPHSYGAVRINGRSEREYLTAAWLDHLQSNAVLPPRELRNVLFAERHGERVVIPALKPIAAWLAIRNEFVREELFERDPELLLQSGDPEQLPLPIKERLLRRVIEQLRALGRRAAGFDERVLRALAEPALAGFLREQWRSARDQRTRDPQQQTGNEEIQVLLLRLIRAGELRPCGSIALEAARTPVKRYIVQIFGISALQKLGIAEDINRFIRELITKAVSWPAEALREALETFFPSHLTVLQAADVLDRLVEKSAGDAPRASNEPRRALQEMVAAADSRAIRLELASALARRLVLRDAPDADEEPSGIWQQLGPGFLKLIARILREDAPDAVPEGVALAFAHGASVSPVRYEMREASAEIRKALAGWVGRADLFQLLLERFEQWGPRFAGVVQPAIRVSCASDAVGLTEADLAWLLDGAKRRAIRVEVFHALLDLWLRAGRPAPLRARIEAFAEGDTQLLALLKTASQKPKPSRFDKQEAKRRREEQARKAKEDKAWDDFALMLRNDPSLLTDSAGKASNAQLQRLWGLRSWMEGKGEKDNHRYSIANLEALEEKFGKEVTAAAKEAFKAYWRAQWTKLPSELKPEERSSVLYSTILGLTGVAIEAREGNAWIDALSEREVQAAVRLALRELNGLPVWFSILSRARPAIVYEILVQEIRAELGEAEAHPELLQRLRYERAQDLPELAAHMVMLLENEDVRSDRALDYLLAIVAQSDSLDSGRLLRLTRQKLARPDLREPQRVAYLSLLFAVDAREGLRELHAWLKRNPASGRAGIVMRVLAHAAGEDRAAQVRYPEGSEVATLEQLILLAFKYVRYEDDVQHAGAYSPGLRDHAEHARDRLVNTLLRIAGREAFDALKRLSKSPDLRPVRSWLHVQARLRAEIDADKAWLPREVYEFESQHEHQPKDGDELLRLVRRRLEEIADYLAGGDFSQAELLGEKDFEERQYQLWLAGQLEMLRRGFYSVSREEEVKDKKRPDIRIHNLPADTKVSIEIKIADDWSGSELKSAFTHQLIKRYLRDPRCRHGMLVLIGRGKRRSWRLGRRTVTTLPELANALRTAAAGQKVLKSAGLAADVIAFVLPEATAKRNRVARAHARRAR